MKKLIKTLVLVFITACCTHVASAQMVYENTNPDHSVWVTIKKHVSIEVGGTPPMESDEDLITIYLAPGGVIEYPEDYSVAYNDPCLGDGFIWNSFSVSVLEGGLVYDPLDDSGQDDGNGIGGGE